MRSVFPFTSRPRGRLAVLGGVAVLAGCVLGSTPKTYRPAQAVGGVTTQVRVLRADGSLATVRGELLLVTDSSLLVRTDHGVIYTIPNERVRSAVFPDASSYGFSGRSPLSDERRQELGLFARFPYGVEPAVMDSLLAREGQTAPEDVDTRGAEPGIPTDLRVMIDTDAQLWVRGELVAVEDTALLVRTPARTVVRVPYACITEASFERFPTPAGVGRRGSPDPSARQALAQRARYRATISEEEMHRLLPPGTTEPTAVRCVGR